MKAPAATNESPDSDAIVEQAADWLVRVQSEDASPEDHSAFDAWKQSDPRHALAASRMVGLVERVRSLRHVVADTRPLHATLEAVGHPSKRRSQFKRLGAALALLLVLSASGWLTLQSYPPAYLLADISTATGQPKTMLLADNTRITLKGGSAVNLHYDEKARTVDLVRGEILLDVAPDAQRPLVVETRHGSMQALGTRFGVRGDEDATVLTMLESRVLVKAAAPSEGENRAGLVVRAGQRLRLGAAGLGVVERVDIRSVEDAWKFNQLLVHDAPLPEVLDELARQRVGLIRFDRAALEHIKVSAVLPLGDTDQALRLLAASHYLRVSSYTRWLVSVEAPARP